MFCSTSFLTHIHPNSTLYNSPPLRRRRLFTGGIVKSVALLASRNPYSILNPFSTKMDHNSGAEPSPQSDAVEDYVRLSDSDLREVMPTTKYRADPDGDAASVSVDDDEVRGGFEERRIGGSGEGCFEERRILPEELAKGVLHLECESSAEGGRCDVYLVGTAHVSQESCTEVQAVIRYLKPEVVFLELCSSRIAILTPQNLKVPTFNEMIDMWKKKKANTFGILYSWFLAKVAERLEVFPGAEFRVAFEEAISYGARVFLGDRPVNITLRRTWGKMSVWHRAKFLYYIIFQTFFLPSPEDLNKMLKDMDDVDVLTLVIQEMSKAFPTIMETVLHERDIYMSSTLWKVASEHSSVVAVVGKGHLPGIRRNWKQPVDVKLLLQIPSSNAAISRTKIIASGVAVAGVAVAYSIYLMGKRVAILAIGWIVFFAAFIPIHFLVTGQSKWKRYIERALVEMICGIFVTSWTGVVKYHGPRPSMRPHQVFVANHTSMIDFIILEQMSAFAVIMQKHPGWVGFIQKHILENVGCIWFNRTEAKDRETVARKLRQHVQGADTNPLLIFPEGTCVNNQYTVMFKKGAFELGCAVCPVAIKYNKIFVDAFWNSKKQSFTKHLFRLMTSWAVVCDVWYLEPQYLRPGETSIEFAERVRDMIAARAGLKKVPWDGYLKYFRPSPKLTEKKQQIFAESVLQLLPIMDLNP